MTRAMERSDSVYIDIKRLERVGSNISNDEERWEKLSIYRVPSQVARLNERAYIPQLVSIGPYHNGKPHLLPMEEHKYRALFHFLRRSETDIQDYIAPLKEVAQQLMDSYEKLDKEWTDEVRFAELMLLDGCFLIEVLRAKSKICLGYASNDPVFSNHGVFTSIYNFWPDLLMVENQVPMLALERLLDVERGTTDEAAVHINKLMVCFCEVNEVTRFNQSLHLLDLTRKIKIGSLPHEKLQLHPFNKNSLRPSAILAASQLKKAGIIFKKVESNSFGSISFNKLNGVISLPVIHVSPISELLLLNLSAFERLHMASGQEVSSFIDLISCLVQCADDAKLLKSKGIIVSSLGEHENNARFVQKLRHDINFIPKGSFYQLRIDLEHYYWSKTSKWKKRFRDWRSNFKETYFKSPWSLIALFAASLLLLLTIEQSLYTTLSYYKSR